MAEHILTNLVDGVLTVTLNRPDKKNALTQAMYSGLNEAIARAENEKGVRVLRINAHGDAFTSGNDVADFLNQSGNMEEAPVVKFLHAISGTDVPIVAAVNGLAVGVGVTLLLHCDFVIAHEDALFSTPFVDLGLVPEAASSLIMPLQMGYKRAAEMLLLCDTLTAEQASEAGLVSQLAGSAGLEERSQDIARRLAAKPKSSLRQSKRLMRRSFESLDERIRVEMEAFSTALASPEAHEAMSAFMEKRAPDFSQFD